MEEEALEELELEVDAQVQAADKEQEVLELTHFLSVEEDLEDLDFKCELLYYLFNKLI